MQTRVTVLQRWRVRFQRWPTNIHRYHSDIILSYHIRIVAVQ